MQYFNVTLPWNVSDAGEGFYATTVKALGADEALRLAAEEMADSSANRFDSEAERSAYIKELQDDGGCIVEKALAEVLAENRERLVVSPALTTLTQNSKEQVVTDHVIRYVATVPCKDGIGRTMMLPAQGRHTYATPEEAQAWIDAYLANNSAATLDKFGRDVQVRPCKCYPGHFDPMNVWFDMPDPALF